ncbi:MAG: HDOD domain-containing protein [Rhodocyclaceae bacterium]|nr:HDOD domain-containing protein [Rhodocyclaceae bacterium]MDZ4214920.1 HDOD domain-containing protein [Rhodocyclaceae bacterium]
MTEAPASAPTVAPLDVESRMGIEVRNIGIPPRPAILDQINREMANSDPDFNHLAELIGSDVALSASLIKVANSPYYGFSKKVRSVQEALLVLGLKVTVRTIAGLSLKAVFKRAPSFERFWDASAGTARVSGWLVQQLPRGHGIRAEDAYTFGLFRDCGIPVLMIPFPEYRGILHKANEEALLPFTDVEDAALSINHAIVGAELAENWLLPEDIHQAIRYHHALSALLSKPSPGISPAAQRLIALAQLAEYLIQQNTDQDHNHTQEWPKLGAACLALLGLGDDDLPALVAGSGTVVHEDE